MRDTHTHTHRLLAPEIFDSISEYVITKPQLCGKVLGIRTNDAIVLGCPVCVEHPKYQRNALFFNLGFVFPSSMPTHATRPYRYDADAVEACDTADDDAEPSRSLR